MLGLLFFELHHAHCLHEFHLMLLICMSHSLICLCHLNLHHIFDLVITYEDTLERKPSRAPFAAALGGLELRAEEVLMVGDWPERDMVGAQNVGIRTVFARYGNTFGTTSSGADFEIDDIFDLVGIVDRLNSVEKGQVPATEGNG